MKMNDEKMERIVRRLVGFDDSIMMMRGTDTRFECGCFLLFFFLFFLAFLSPAHIWGEKSGSVGSTH